MYNQLGPSVSREQTPYEQAASGYRDAFEHLRVVIEMIGDKFSDAMYSIPKAENGVSGKPVRPSDASIVMFINEQADNLKAATETLNGYIRDCRL